MSFILTKSTTCFPARSRDWSGDGATLTPWAHKSIHRWPKTTADFLSKSAKLFSKRRPSPKRLATSAQRLPTSFVHATDYSSFGAKTTQTQRAEVLETKRFFDHEPSDFVHLSQNGLDRFAWVAIAITFCPLPCFKLLCFHWLKCYKGSDSRIQPLTNNRHVHNYRRSARN